MTEGRLRREIKEATKPTLDEVSVVHLRLHRVTIDTSLEEEACVNELNRLSENLEECALVDPMEILSPTFYDNPPTNKMYIILVRASRGESIYCGGVVLIADVH